MKTLWNNFINLFYPHLCLLCKTPLAEGENQVCLHCLYDLPHTHYIEHPSDNPAIHLIANQKEEITASAFLHYEKGGKVQQLIHSLKYHDNKELAYLLGQSMAKEILSSGYTFMDSYLIPVPLHPQKEKKRRYNQAEWIAKGIASVISIPVNTTTLLRKKKNDSQTQKSVYERWLNVEEIFYLTDFQILSGKHILIIDDVITTGATISACIETLKNIPDIQITVLALAIA